MKKLLLCLLFILLHFISALAEPQPNPPLKLLNPPHNTPSQPNSITSPSNSVEELKDIYGPVIIKEQTYLGLYIVVSALLLLIGVSVILYLLSKRKKSTIPKISSWQKALDEVTKARNLFDNGEHIKYMDKLSLILRTYIESRFAIKSTKQTTQEFLHSIHTKSPLQKYKKQLKEWLQQADTAKFAKSIPTDKNLVELETGVINFINKTIPIEERDL